MDVESNSIQSLSEDTDLLAVAFDSMSNGILVCDYQQRDMPVLYCNKPFEQITGYKLKEIKGKNPRFMQGDSNSEESRRIIRQCLINGTSCMVELLNHKKDGSIYWIELSLSPVKNNAGQITYYVGRQIDISERKLRELNENFSTKQAEKLQEIREEFINIASHQLKTPLTTLTASIQQLDRINYASPESSKRLIKQSERSVSKMKNLVDDLMLFTNIREDQLYLNKVSFPLSGIISTCCSAVKSAGRHQLIMMGNHESVVFADKKHIEHIVTNIVNNASKYGEHCDRIELNVEEEEDMARISITDNGPGIDEEQLPYLFDRHYRSSVTGVLTSGLGIGLYVCSEIVKRHAGKIGVISDKGKGSTFWFTLPLCNNYYRGINRL